MDVGYINQASLYNERAEALDVSTETDLLRARIALRRLSEQTHRKEAVDRPGAVREALDLLSRVVRAGFSDREGLEEDEAFEPLRNEPGYRMLIKDLGERERAQTAERRAPP